MDRWGEDERRAQVSPETRYEDRTATTGFPRFRVFCTLVHVRAHHTRSTVRLRRTTSRPSPTPGQPPHFQSVFFVDDCRNRKQLFSYYPRSGCPTQSRRIFFCIIILNKYCSSVRRSRLRLRAVDCSLASTSYGRRAEHFRIGSTPFRLTCQARPSRDFRRRR